MHTDLVTLPSAVLDRLAALGLDVAALLRHAAIPRARFHEARVKLTTREFFALWQSFEPAGGTRAAALRLGADTLPHQLDVASLAALHSANLGEGLGKFARYKRLVCAEEVGVEVARSEARIAFRWVYGEGALPLILVDVTFASLLAIARHGAGADVTPLRIELARKRGDEALLRGHFGCTIRFDAPRDVLVFDEALLARPFVTHNPDLIAVMIPGLESQLARDGASRSIVDQVKRVLSRGMGGARPSVEKVAKEMHMSQRTLQRRLDEAGTTYQKVLDEVRRDNARRLLDSTDLDTGEVAFLLGFEEINSFTRVFHAWEGTTPARWRKDAQAMRAKAAM